jgi:hypothetical protein
LRERVPSVARRVRVSVTGKTLTRPRLTPQPPSPAVQERGYSALLAILMAWVGVLT